MAYFLKKLQISVLYFVIIPYKLKNHCAIMLNNYSDLEKLKIR